MKFNLKTVLLIDLIIILFGIITPFFGQQIGDFVHPSKNKAFYKEINQDIDGLYTNSTNGNPVDQNKIDQINKKMMDNSLELYGYKLNGSEESLTDLEKILSELSTKHVYGGDKTMLAIYISSLVQAKTQSEWIKNNGLSGMVLKSKNNEEKIDLVWYIEERKVLSATDVTGYYSESIKKLGGK